MRITEIRLIFANPNNKSLRKIVTDEQLEIGFDIAQDDAIPLPVIRRIQLHRREKREEE